jgi:hypothetical protein
MQPKKKAFFNISNTIVGIAQVGKQMSPAETKILVFRLRKYLINFEIARLSEQYCFFTNENERDGLLAPAHRPLPVSELRITG